MGIEIPPPKGGPAVFTTSSPGNQSSAGLSSDEERLRTPELGEDLNDGGSASLSEGLGHLMLCVRHITNLCMMCV